MLKDSVCYGTNYKIIQRYFGNCIISSMTNISYCTFYIARHGETKWNKDRLLLGQSDIELNKNGIQQARELAQSLQKIHFDAVYSSDLLRAKRTAEIVVLEKKLAVTTTEALRERFFGEFEGRKIPELIEEIKDLLKQFNELSEEEKHIYKFTSGWENDKELISRFLTFLRELAVAYLGKKVLVVCHDGIIRTLLWKMGEGTYKELDYDVLTIHNSAYIVAESDGVDFFLKDTFKVDGLPKYKG